MQLRKRLRNKVFVCSLVAYLIGFVCYGLESCGIQPPLDGNLLYKAFECLAGLLVLLGILIDPTTPGITDGDEDGKC